MFADESGDFGCRRATGVSRYFILTTVTLADCDVGDALLALRRRLAWEGYGLNSDLHATTETQAVRDEVFALLRGADIRVDATLLDKPKLDPKYHGQDSRIYGLVWSLHMRRLAGALTAPGDELLVVSAAIGTKQTRKRFYEAVTAEVARAAPAVQARTAHWASLSDPCLQVADYCGWAIQRRWEHTWAGQPDTRSHVLIADKIRSEVNVFARNTVTHY